MAETTPTTRVRSVDVIRGLVMIFMALDHVRVYSGIPPGGPTAGVFLTRWITHFCAPAFIFLAGTSCALALPKHGRAAMSRRLLVRGLWLVLLEVTVLRVAWTFNLEFHVCHLAGVIWAIGWCMVLMAGLIHLPVKVLAVLGITIIAGHDLVADLCGMGNPWREHYPWFMRFLYTGGFFRIGSDGPEVIVLYSVVPWIGVMAAGFAFAHLLRLPRERRDPACLKLGLGMIAAFLILRATDWYGDPRPWATSFEGWPAWIAFLNVLKYPASLLFLLMTLGPVIAAVPLAERLKGPVSTVVSEFGRVPLFYYLLHIPVIHALVVVVALFRTPDAVSWLFGNHPVLPGPVPDGYTFGLPLLYLVTASALVILYFACRWFGRVRTKLPKKVAWMF